jgi:hypothetical protein
MKNGFTLDYLLPVDTPPQLSIDSITGKILYKPVRHKRKGSKWIRNTNFYTVPVLAREFRLDTTWVGGNPVVKRKQIGYVSRFVTFVVTPDSLCNDSGIVFVDTVNRKPTSFIELDCDDNPFKVGFRLPMRCSSIDSDASCFVLLSQNGDTIPLLKAEGICRYDDITDDALIYVDSILGVGTYYLMVKQGRDGNTLISQCGSEMVAYNDTLMVIKNSAPVDESFLQDTLGIITDHLEPECRAMEMTFFTSYPVQCKSLKADGSDFYLVDSTSSPIRQVDITKAIPKNCNNDYTREITLQFSKPIEAGNYKLYLKEGNDGNTLKDACHRTWPYLVTDVLVAGPHVDLGPDIKICNRDTVNVTLKAPPGYTYKWSTGQFKDSITVTQYGTYWVQVWSNTGCLSTDTINIVEINCTGIEEQSTGFSFSIRPNPAKDRITVELNRDAQNWQVELLDLQGRVVCSWSKLEGKSAVLWLPKELQAGSYLVKVIAGSGISTERLVIPDS